jgi:hypothetical protein
MKSLPAPGVTWTAGSSARRGSTFTMISKATRLTSSWRSLDVEALRDRYPHLSFAQRDPEGDSGSGTRFRTGVTVIK